MLSYLPTKVKRLPGVPQTIRRMGIRSQTTTTQTISLVTLTQNTSAVIRRAIRLAPVTERLLRDAGIAPGNRVLDLGSEVGDVAMLVRIVGRSGEVVAIERNVPIRSVVR